MGTQRTILTNFTGGEVTPYMNARVDVSRYFNSAALLENFIVLDIGAIERRGGTRFIREVKDSTKPGVLIPFEHADQQAYIIEGGEAYFRFYRDKGQVELVPGTPYEIATPYFAADLDRLRWTQSNDVAYLTEVGYQPEVLSRTADTAWTLLPLDIKDGPYQDENPTSIKLTLGNTTGAAVTVTATPNAKAITGAADNGAGLVRLLAVAHGLADGDPAIVSAVGGTVEANGKWTVNKIDANHVDLQGSKFVNAWTAGGTISANVFDATRDVGRLLRLKPDANWGYGRITAVTNEWTAVIDIKTDFGVTTATAAWRLGLWSDVLGWPSVVTIHQQRVVFGSKTALRPQRVDGSRIGAFDQTSVTMTPGTNDTDAIAFNIGAEQASPVTFLLSSGVLLVGTQGGPFVVSADTSKAALKPTEGNALAQGRRRCAAAAALAIDNAIIFIDRLRRKLRELTYDIGTDTFVADDLARTAETSTRSGLAQIVVQQDPWDVVWSRRNDGTLAGLTYVPKEQVAGWHRHILGRTLGGAAVIESMASKPGDIGTDELWLLVRRVINGQIKRYVEVLEDPLPLDGAQQDGFYVDCGLTYQGPPPPNLILTGLEHLEGEQVQVCVDGAVQPVKTVAGGQITLDPINPAATAITVHVGLQYVSKLVPLPLEAGATAGTSQALVKIIRQMAVRFLRSFAGKAGRDEASLVEINSDRDPSVPMDSPMPLFSGDANVDFPGDYETAGKFVILQDQPLPMTITGVVVLVEASDE